MTIINRKVKLRDFYGILSKETGDALEKNIKEARKINRNMHEKRIERVKDMFK